MYQGFVPGPAFSSRVSIHSPPERAFSKCSSAQISCSVLPGSEFSYIRAMPASQTRMAQLIISISSGLLMARAFSVSSWPST